MIPWSAAFCLFLAVSFSGSAIAQDLRARVGQPVTLEGVAEVRKLGAALRGTGFEVWIDRMHEWPAAAAGRKVRVTGVLEERHDLPVYIPKAGEPPAGGIPVPEGTDLRQASRRFVVREAKWSLIE